MTPLLEFVEVRKVYEQRGLLFQGRSSVAVDRVSMEVHEGETLGVVGETGSGKSTLGKMIVRLEAPTEGTIRYCGRDITLLNRGDARKYAGQVQMIFQDPYSSLNPYKTIAQTLARPLRIHTSLSGSGLMDRTVELLELVGLKPATKHLERYPHELSGGERQRVAIARALSPGAKLIVADEPVSSLDVSVRAQILRLLKKTQEEIGVSYFFVTHDLGILPSISHRVAVVYKGRLVEVGRTKDVVDSPRHPYTIALLASMPIPDPVMARRRIRIPPGPKDNGLSIGCAFAARCSWATRGCRVRPPPLIEHAGRKVACLPERLAFIEKTCR